MTMRTHGVVLAALLAAASGIFSVASYVLLKTGVVAAPHTVACGVHVFVGSFLFGFLMPFVGGCMLGTRVGTGISTSADAFLGILLGNLLGPVLVWDLTKALAAPTTGFVLSVAVGLEAAMAVKLAAPAGSGHAVRGRSCVTKRPHTANCTANTTPSAKPPPRRARAL